MKKPRASTHTQAIGPLRLVRLVPALATVCGLLLPMSAAFAGHVGFDFGDGGGEVPSITNALQALVDVLTGTTARLMAIIAIAAVGYFWLAGRLSLRHAVTTGISIGIIFGAPTIAHLLGAG